MLDHGFDDTGAGGFVADDVERSRPPKDELRPERAPTPPPPLDVLAGTAVDVEVAGKEPKSPNPAAEGDTGPDAAAGLDANKLMISFLPRAAPDAEAVVGLAAELDAEGSCQSRSKMPPPPPEEALAVGGATGAALVSAFAVAG